MSSIETTGDRTMEKQGGYAIDSLEQCIRTELPHLTEQDAGSLAAVVRRLVDAYQPERVYLFGSKARGESRPG